MPSLFPTVLIAAAAYRLVTLLGIHFWALRLAAAMTADDEARTAP